MLRDRLDDVSSIVRMLSTYNFVLEFLKGKNGKGL